MLVAIAIILLTSISLKAQDFGLQKVENIKRKTEHGDAQSQNFQGFYMNMMRV